MLPIPPGNRIQIPIKGLNYQQLATFSTKGLRISSVDDIGNMSRYSAIQLLSVRDDLKQQKIS